MLSTPVNTLLEYYPIQILATAADSAASRSEIEQRTDAQFLKKGKWSQEEDNALLKGVQKYMAPEWDRIAKEFVKTRIGEQCRARWKIIRTDSRKGTWTEDENDALHKGVEKYGAKKWDLIASIFVKKHTGDQCRHHWKIIAQKSQTSLCSTEEEHAHVSNEKIEKEAPENPQILPTAERAGILWDSISPDEENGSPPPKKRKIDQICTANGPLPLDTRSDETKGWRKVTIEPTCTPPKEKRISFILQKPNKDRVFPQFRIMDTED